MQATHDLGRGVVSGVKGVWERPMQHAKQDGVRGFVEGLTLGVVGLVTAPTAAALKVPSAAFCSCEGTGMIGFQKIICSRKEV